MLTSERWLRGLALWVSGGLALVCLVWPPLLVDTSGRADHAAASVLFIGISLGLPAGLGFRVVHPVGRLLLHPGVPLVLMGTGLLMI